MKISRQKRILNFKKITTLGLCDMHGRNKKQP